MRKWTFNVNFLSRASMVVVLVSIFSVAAISSQAKHQNVVFEGTVANLGKSFVIVRTDRGARHQVIIDSDTHVLRDNVEFSIANRDRIGISAIASADRQQTGNRS